MGKSCEKGGKIIRLKVPKKSVRGNKSGIRGRSDERSIHWKKNAKAQAGCESAACEELGTTKGMVGIVGA